MSKVCQVCGKGPATGHNVSHSMRHTKRRFLPNLVTKKVFNISTGDMEKKKLCTRCLRTAAKV